MFNTGLIWGAILIIIGASILINVIFGINLPIFRILAASFLIYLGISMLVPRQRFFYSFYSLNTEQTEFHDNNTADYSVAFGKRHIDLSNISEDEVQTVNINCSMGSIKVRLNPDIPTKIIVHASFGEVKFPDHSTHSMGTTTYRIHPQQEPVLLINVSVAFGSVKFVY